MNWRSVAEVVRDLTLGVAALASSYFSDPWGRA